MPWADDAADRGLEPVRHLAHAGLALLLRRCAGERGLLLELAGPDEVLPEHLHGPRHRADLVAAAAIGDLRGRVAVGQAPHRPGHPLDRARHTDEAERHRADGDQDGDAEHQQRRPDRGALLDPNRGFGLLARRIVDVDEGARGGRYGEVVGVHGPTEEGHGLVLAIGREGAQAFPVLPQHVELRFELVVDLLLFNTRDQRPVSIDLLVPFSGELDDLVLALRSSGLVLRGHVTKLPEPRPQNQRIDGMRFVDGGDGILEKTGGDCGDVVDLPVSRGALQDRDDEHRCEKASE
jgi:hypothetical protein